MWVLFGKVVRPCTLVKNWRAVDGLLRNDVQPSRKVSWSLKRLFWVRTIISSMENGLLKRKKEVFDWCTQWMQTDTKYQLNFMVHKSKTRAIRPKFPGGYSFFSWYFEPFLDLLWRHSCSIEIQKNSFENLMKVYSNGPFTNYARFTGGWGDWQRFINSWNSVYAFWHIRQFYLPPLTNSHGISQKVFNEMLNFSKKMPTVWGVWSS